MSVEVVNFPEISRPFIYPGTYYFWNVVGRCLFVTNARVRMYSIYMVLSRKSVSKQRVQLKYIYDRRTLERARAPKLLIGRSS